MKKYCFISILMLLLSSNLFAQTFAGATGGISDHVCQYFPVNVSGLTNASRFRSITFSITHTYDSDLNIYLIAPNGTTIEISTGNGGSSQNYTNTTIDIGATTSILSGSAPYTGTYLPEGSLNVLNGINLNGEWTLKVCDTADRDTGSLDNWSITFAETILADSVSFTPETAAVSLGSDTIISGQIKKTGLTDTSTGQAPGIQAWVGFSATNTNPATWTNWVPATFHQEVGDNDEYQGPVGSAITPPGSAYYAMRYQIANSFYIYAGTNNGVWDGATHGNGVLTITPAPAPANDNCSGAIPITISQGYVCNTSTSGTVSGATASPVDANLCGGSEDDDVWFSFVATSAVHVIYITDVTGSTTDLYNSVWSGTDCDHLTLLPGSCSDANNQTLSGLVIGQTYYLRVYTTTAVPYHTTSFNICITTAAPVPDFVSLETPSANIYPGESITVYGRFVEAGLTNVTSGQAPYIQAWIGYNNTTAGNPNSSTWTNWIPATFHQEAGDSDEYMATFGSDLPNGTYYFATRFKLANGEYYYGGIDSAGNGNFWSNTYSNGILRIRPLNDDCENATPLTIGNTFDEFVVTGSLYGASDFSLNYITCNGNSIPVNSGVYYSVVIPPTGSIAIETKAADNPIYDTVIVASIGDCNQLIGMGCNDNRYPNNYSRVVMFNQTPGNILKIAVYVKGTNWPSINSHRFKISAYNATLATDTFDDAAFSYSPNPVTDQLHLSYSKEIATVEVFDAMGRKVYALNNLPKMANVDMASLSHGIYMVRITSDNQAKTIKIIKD